MMHLLYLNFNILTDFQFFAVICSKHKTCDIRRFLYGFGIVFDKLSSRLIRLYGNGNALRRSELGIFARVLNGSDQLADIAFGLQFGRDIGI